MSTDSHPAFLHRLVRGRKRRRELDLGDMGTAFALDQSFDEGSAFASAPAAPAPARWSMRFWLGRKSGG